MRRESTSARALRVYGVMGTGLALLALRSDAAVSYSMPNMLYTQNFNSLPTSPENQSIEGTFTDGWQDDVDPALSPESDISIPGWYLWHVLSPASENGFNGRQRFRVGAGTTNTGAFWSFGASGNTERALGSVGSTTVSGTAPADDRVLTALRLTNNTGQTLNSFTLTYTGEQWRDGGSATPSGETLLFDYSVGATLPQDTTFTAVPALNFTTPVFTNTGTGAAVDGNATANRQTLTATVDGINWGPGQDLWLRWNDPQRSGNDHGLAIDDVTFVAAVPEPGALGFAAAVTWGLLSSRRRR